MMDIIKVIANWKQTFVQIKSYAWYMGLGIVLLVGVTAINFFTELRKPNTL